MTRIHLDQFALERLLLARVGTATKRLADELADTVRQQGIKVGDVDGGKSEIPLPVRTYSDPDGKAAVVLAHPAGISVQAKHGSLTRAAASKGLEVRS